MKYIFLLIILINTSSLFAQSKNGEEYVIVDVDSVVGKYVGCNTVLTTDSKRKEIYILNVRYKLNQNKRSRINDNADFMFTFYIIPNKKIILKEVLRPDEIKKRLVVNIDEIRTRLLSAGYDDFFDFKPIIKTNNKYYVFENCIIVAQAFDLQEDSQYFPQYGEKSYKYKLNLLSKPYTRESIDSSRKIIMKDSTALRPFDIWIDDFYDKWFISKIDRKNKTVDFWIDLKPIHDAEYSFGRTTTEIKYKIGIGITDFTLIPSYSIFNGYFEDSLKDDGYFVKFNFKEFIDMKTLVK